MDGWEGKRITVQIREKEETLGIKFYDWNHVEDKIAWRIGEGFPCQY